MPFKTQEAAYSHLHGEQYQILKLWHKRNPDSDDTPDIPNLPTKIRRTRRDGQFRRRNYRIRSRQWRLPVAYYRARK